MMACGDLRWAEERQRCVLPHHIISHHITPTSPSASMPEVTEDTVYSSRFRSVSGMAEAVSAAMHLGEDGGEERSG